MSTVSQITVTAAIDGTTVQPLTPNLNPQTQFHEDTFVNAGIFDLDDLTDTEGDMYLQQFSVDAPLAATITVLVLLPDGLTLDISTKPFNIIVPKGARVQVSALDGLGAPVPGTIFFWVWSYGSDDWATLQQCHAFSPCATDGVVPNGGGAAALGRGADFSANAAAVNGGYQDNSMVLRVGTRANAAGSFNGGGTGNKSIFGAFGFSGLPIGSLTSLSYTWENADGPGGPFFNPAGGGTVTTPYVNLVVDFDPLGAGDLRILVTNDDSLAGAVTAAVGTYSNPGGLNVLTYAWDGLTQDVLIVNAPPNPVPGGVPPNVNLGPTWFDRTYTWSALIAANPTAILLDAFTGAGGLPAGAVTPAVMLVSGDSGNVVRSGKKIRSFAVNGTNVLV